MRWFDHMRELRVLAGRGALLLAAGCGGGDQTPTGPGGDHDGVAAEGSV